MALEKELKLQSIVILAQSFNTSVFNRHWLVKNNFVEESEIQQNSIFVPGISQIVTRKYNLLVVPEQLQFNVGFDSINFGVEIQNTLLPIIQKLQEIPYRAIGINLSWFIKDTEKDIKTLSKEHFFIEKSTLFQNFDTNNSRFGTYLSKDFNNTRLKLDIKPVNMLDDLSRPVSEHILCSFNFHLDLKPDNSAEELIETINKWGTFKEESQRIVNLL
ncbi:MAG: hypothetical protein IPO21_08185 [Bacteroidales bacterium]|nr:hypothetical protein [Bacteroidales bacterium]